MRHAAPAAYVAEPPAVYLARPPIVVDCSVLAAILFDETLGETAGQLIVGRTLHAPWLLDHEIASVADRKRRAGLPAAAVDAALQRYEAQQVTLHRAEPAPTLTLAVAYSLSTYDAAYLVVAAELRIPLVTFDHKLGKAAGQHLGALE